MTQQHPKFLFDECALSVRAVDVMRQVLEFAEPERRAILKHKLRFRRQGEGVWDEVWIPQAAGEGWVIVTADRGKKGGTRKGQKLPRLCREHHVTHILFSGGMMRRKQFDKVLSLLSVWYDMLQTAQSPPGTQYMLEPTSLGRAVLREKRPPEDEPPLAPPGYLFDA